MENDLGQQYRKAIEKDLVEIPAGKLEREKMQIKAAALREWKRKLATQRI